MAAEATAPTSAPPLHLHPGATDVHDGKAAAPKKSTQAPFAALTRRAAVPARAVCAGAGTTVLATPPPLEWPFHAVAAATAPLPL